jgi:hypothetical protein
MELSGLKLKLQPFYPRETAPGTPWTRGWVVISPALDKYAMTISGPVRNSTAVLQSSSPQASQYAD